MKKEIEKFEKYISTAAKQSSIVFIGKIFGYLFGFLISFLIARYYNAKIMGQYSLVQTVLNIMMIVTVFGVDKGLVKYIPRYFSNNEEKNLKIIIKTALKFGFIFSLIGSLLIFFTKGFISNNVFNDPELLTALKYGAWIILP